MRKQYLVFRPYEDPMRLRPYLPPDRGYNFMMHGCDIKILRYTLEDNGFRDSKLQKQENNQQQVVGQQGPVQQQRVVNDGTWTIFWQVGPIKK